MGVKIFHWLINTMLKTEEFWTLLRITFEKQDNVSLHILIHSVEVWRDVVGPQASDQSDASFLKIWVLAPHESETTGYDRHSYFKATIQPTSAELEGVHPTSLWKTAALVVVLTRRQTTNPGHTCQVFSAEGFLRIGRQSWNWPLSETQNEQLCNVANEHRQAVLDHKLS